MANDVAKALLTKSQATKLCEQIRAGIQNVSELVWQLHEGQGWTALGYMTWKECIAQEFHHKEWWGRNQLRIAEVRKALPPPPPKEPSQRGKRHSGMPLHPTTQNGAVSALSDRAATALADVPEADREAVLEAASSDGKPPTAAAIREAAKGESLGKCPNCKGSQWDHDEDGVSCSRCHHPHGEPAGDVDEPKSKNGKPVIDTRKFKSFEQEIGKCIRMNTDLRKHTNGKGSEHSEAIRKHFSAAIEELTAWRRAI